MAKSEAYKRAQAKYDKEKRKLVRKQYLFALYYATDQSVIDKLDSVESRTDYIRQLVRYDMEHHIITEENSDNSGED